MHQVLVIAAGIILAAVVLQRWRTLMRIVVVLLLAAGLAIAVVAPIATGGLLGWVAAFVVLIVAAYAVEYLQTKRTLRREQRQQLIEAGRNDPNVNR
jgi:uncharacterized membrane protein YjjP (DUF1212 family)